MSKGAYTEAELRELAIEYAKGDLILNGNSRRKYRRDVAQRAFHRLIETALAASSSASQVAVLRETRAVIARSIKALDPSCDPLNPEQHAVLRDDLRRERSTLDSIIPLIAEKSEPS